ncbi:hypothetical protein Gasu2_65490 [Galdieria sulphuraria]|nr:hypothetical protein Gasu2_65490 [Galdieria sulphuraria]
MHPFSQSSGGRLSGLLAFSESYYGSNRTKDIPLSFIVCFSGHLFGSWKTTLWRLGNFPESGSIFTAYRTFFQYRRVFLDDIDMCCLVGGECDAIFLREEDDMPSRMLLRPLKL